MTALEHADKIMASPRGSFLLVCEPVFVTPMKGGELALTPGARVRVHVSDGTTMHGITENAEDIMFGANKCFAFEAKPQGRRK